MNRTVQKALLEARQGALTKYVIEWAGSKVGSVKRGLASAAKRAGVAHASPHMLRHSAAVHMAEAGVTMDEIAQYLGHDDIEVTRRIYLRALLAGLLAWPSHGSGVRRYRFIEPERTT
jgi:integrase